MEFSSKQTSSIFSVSYQRALSVLLRSNKPLNEFFLLAKLNWKFWNLHCLHPCLLARSLLLPCNLLAQCYFSWHIITTRNQWNSVKPLARMYVVWLSPSAVRMRYKQNGNPLIKTFLYSATFIRSLHLTQPSESHDSKNTKRLNHSVLLFSHEKRVSKVSVVESITGVVCRNIRSGKRTLVLCLVPKIGSYDSIVLVTFGQKGPLVVKNSTEYLKLDTVDG